MNTAQLLGRFIVCSLALGGSVGATFGQEASASHDRAPQAATLRQAGGKRVLVGTAVSARGLDNPKYAGLVAEQFGCLTAGNEMKPDSLQRVKGTFTFDRADKIVTFAHANNLQVIGHTLCWHQQSPKWMFEDESGKPLPREAALANLKTHIETVVKHFKGKVKGWDVVNEAVNDGAEPWLRDTPARRAIGDDFVLKAFEFAHAADPDVELYYNDYNIEQDYKRERGLRMIREIKAAGLRIDGVGVQGHWMLESDLAEIDKGIKAYADLGVKVMITELDVDPLPRKKGGGADLNATEKEGLDPYKDGLPADMQEKLAAKYRAIFEVLMKYPQINRVTFWGVTDGDTWLNNFPVRGRTNHPMLWDRQYKAKPAFDEVWKVMQSNLKTASAAKQ